MDFLLYHLWLNLWGFNMGIFVTKDEAKARLNICNDCDKIINPMKICNVCNCYMPVKVCFSGASCPKDKWGKSDSKEEEDPLVHVNKY